MRMQSFVPSPVKAVMVAVEVVPTLTGASKLLEFVAAVQLEPLGTNTAIPLTVFTPPAVMSNPSTVY